MKELNYSKIDNIHVDGVDKNDYPDFCDAYISNADYKGLEMTDDQLEQINKDSDFVYQAVINQLF